MIPMLSLLRRLRPAALFAFVTIVVPFSPAAAAPEPAVSAKLSAIDTNDLATFERKAVLAKRLGATHVPLTDGLPVAKWQFQPANDPYPAWFIQRPDFMKLYPPAAVQPYVDMNYGRRITTILEERCKILRRLGLKAHWTSNLPQVMPEAFFAAYPHLRGPRVDQPNRSRTARFSMCVDEPETIQLYSEALQELLKRCPEIETFSFLTQDSGSGFCWVPALYPGPNGPSRCHDRPMSERISGFLVALKNAAKQNGREIEINLNPIEPRQWMIPSFSPDTLDAIVRRLPRGIAVEGREGPDGRPFQGLRASDAYANGAFYPVVGVIVPDLKWLRTGKPLESSVAAQTPQGEAAAPLRRLVSLRPDESVIEFNAKLAEATQQSRPGNAAERLAGLRAFAVAEAGEKYADDLLATWLLIDDAGRRLDALNFGDMLQFGHVLNRWINRPMVLFPDELTPEEKSYYRPFLFQAKGEEQADNLIDIQAMRMYEGYGARLLFQRVIETVVPDVELAIGHIRRIRDGAPDEAAKNRWDLFSRRLEVTLCLLRSADNMVCYQAQLDRVKSLAIKPEANPPLGTQSSWDRSDLVDTARREVDNTVQLLGLLQSTPQPLLDLAAVAEEETIMRLGPDLPAQLKRKIEIMNAHWTDYDRLFSPPNP